MVEVAVGDYDGADLVLAFLDIFCIWQNIIDAGSILILELKADVDDDDIIAHFDHGAVLADLFYAAERDDADRIRRERRNDLCFFCFRIVSVFEGGGEMARAQSSGRAVFFCGKRT